MRMSIRMFSVTLCLVMLVSSGLAWADGCGKKEKNVSLNDIPAPVKATILKTAGSSKISEIEEIIFGDRKIYEAEWQTIGGEVEIQVAADGRLIIKKLEKEVSFNELPFPVRSTVLQNAGENKISEIAEITAGDRKYYEVEWVCNDKEIEIMVNSDGSLLGQKVEEDDDENEDDK
ncbi:hypothetical protein ACFLU6_07855 [Acidobacteriota bacterium]